MEQGEVVVQVTLKPNCGLENTRAALVVRRIAPLCSAVSYYPRSVKGDLGTVDYLRDHGLFVRFASPAPERVLLAIKGAFFVDHCRLVDDANDIPPYETPEEDPGTETEALSPSPSFANRDARDEYDVELARLLACFEETGRALRAHAGSLPRDRTLGGISFAHARAVDELRSAIVRSRIEPFDRIAASLRRIVEDCNLRYGSAVDLEIAEGHVALDRSVLANMEETLRYALKSCIRDGIEEPAERLAAGKPRAATIRIRVENDGSDVICRIEHDGYPFDARRVGEMARERGLLARPLETYSDDEIGALPLLPRFASTGTYAHGSAFAEFKEVGYMLQSAGGRGWVRNTERGTLEIALLFPVPFTVLEVAILRVGSALFALPSQQVLRFEAYRAECIDGTADCASESPSRYLSESGEDYELLAPQKQLRVADAARPRYVALLDALGESRALAVDDVGGYERVTVNQLPTLLNRRDAREAGCIGYAVLGDRRPCAVVSIRRLLKTANGEGGYHARP